LIRTSASVVLWIRTETVRLLNTTFVNDDILLAVTG
jgi:hypothetical protein